MDTEMLGTGKAYGVVPPVKNFEDVGELVATGVGCPDADSLYEKYWNDTPFFVAKNNVLFVRPGASKTERELALSRVYEFDFIVICREDGTYQVRKNNVMLVGRH